MTKPDLSTIAAPSVESRFNLIIIRNMSSSVRRLKSIEVINSFRHPTPVGAAKVTFSNIRTLIAAFIRFEQGAQPLRGLAGLQSTQR